MPVLNVQHRILIVFQQKLNIHSRSIHESEVSVIWVPDHARRPPSTSRGSRCSTQKAINAQQAVRCAQAKDLGENAPAGIELLGKTREARCALHYVLWRQGDRRPGEALRTMGGPIIRLCASRGGWHCSRFPLSLSFPFSHFMMSEATDWRGCLHPLWSKTHSVVIQPKKKDSTGS
jgi:hypothetical protein